MKAQQVWSAAPLQAQGSWAGLGCVALLCARGNLRGWMHLNAGSGAEFGSSGLEQTLVPKRQG